jgi:CO/xanthine dehydrogenase FAD-binding subunit
MAISQRQLSIFTPRTLRDALGLSFRHREAVRWLIGKSSLLATAYTHVPREAQILDVREVDDFRACAFGEGKIRFGAFAAEESLRRHPLLGRTIFAAASSALYLAVSEADVEVVSLGTIRRTPIDALVLAQHEAPLSIEFDTQPDDVYVQRRRTIRDGTASHDLIIGATFRLGDDGRTTRVRVALTIDDGPPIRARLAEYHLQGERLSSERTSVAARLCAESIAPDDPRTAAAARSALTLGLALFREARVRCDEMNRSRRPDPPRRKRRRR